MALERSFIFASLGELNDTKNLKNVVKALMQLSFMVHFPKEKMALERSFIFASLGELNDTKNLKNVAESPVVTAPRFKIIESATISSAAISLATTVETTTSRLTSKRRRTEVGNVRQHSDNDTLITHKQIFYIIEYLDKINNRQIKIEKDISDNTSCKLHNVANIFAKKLKTYLSTIVNNEVKRFYPNDKPVDEKYKIEHEKRRKNFLFKQYEEMADKKIISEILSRQLKYRIIESTYYNEYIDTIIQ
ncbi:hypothetical protein Glove_41g142 [Diversispora epigaea]|uniref:Uncharacterized protein n=1 Tax=Diversispora epigaea TaxID=1348612 RepID=A0A397JFA3_9GLOM|nr:hypothetical protein Glove_41g142 [Diversispora epigaea]